MNDDRLWILIAKKITRNALPTELKELNDWLDSDPVLAEKFKRIKEFFYEPNKEHEDEQTSIAFDKLWRTIKHRQSLQSYEKQTGLNQFLKTNLMLKNYFKIAWRNIIKHRSYTFINVLGLAFSICACIVIFLITDYEFSFDRFHPDGNRIYRIVSEAQRNGAEETLLNSPFSDVAGFQNQIPGFDATAGVYLYGEGVSIPKGNQPPKKVTEELKELTVRHP